MTRLYKLLGVAGFAVSAAAFGTFSGAAVQAALDPTPVYAHCLHDECEGGTSCKDNPGGNTNCPMEGSTCKTQGCGGGGGDEEILQ